MDDSAWDQVEHRKWLCSLVDRAVLGTLLDVGCGEGTDLRTIAEQTPQRNARFIGLDAVAKSVLSAQAANVDDRITFRQHHVGKTLPFEDEMFDVVLSNNFLECVGDKVTFLQEVARVLRPGGQVVFAHWDWDSQTFDGVDKELVRRVVHAFADWQQPWMENCDGWMGRRLWPIMESTGLFAGTIETRVLTNTVYAPPWYGHARVADCAALVEHGAINRDDYRRFVADIEQQAAAGRYFYSITSYVYIGRLRSAPG
jgi:ubiquinone/menaquinone biosynthesis C-methylase UbiE